MSSKYGDDMMFESFADNNIFFPLSDIMIPILYQLKLTPNKVTLLSTICTILSAYFLYINQNSTLFILFYFLGYLFDCVDGRFARKYKMFSKLGLVSDGASDVITNFIVLAVIIVKFRKHSLFVPLLSVLLYFTHKLSIAYGLNEAIDCYSNNLHDNFDKYKRELLDDFGNNCFENLIKKLYIMINKLSYDSYKQKYEEYNHDKMKKILKKVKEYGPGNYCILCIVIIILFNKTN
jgi:hypothetical protein